MSQADPSKLKLMVVDDEPDNLDLLYRTFWREFRVYKAKGAKEALEILDHEGEMAVIISDQRMPLMSGTEFLSKTVDRFPDTMRIILTGFMDVEDLVDAINSGQVFKYITKPWNPENLKAVVQQAAETYQVLKQRTDELRQALRRKELFNKVTTAIRESLDYKNMLQTIVTTIGQTFKATHCILQPTDGDRLLSESFSYSAVPEIQFSPLPQDYSVVQRVVENRQTQVFQQQATGDLYVHLAVPLICQKHLLAVLSVYQQGSENGWIVEDIQLIEEVAEQAALAISQAKLYQRLQLQAQKMHTELEVARQLQNNLLRQRLPEVEGIQLQAYCYPARQVGGDFFEAYAHRRGDIWLAVGDVSGKGVPAALLMASVISLLRRELTQETSPEPEVVISNLNSTLFDDLVSTGHMVTMVLARYTPSSQQLVYANAGHIAPLVWSHRLLLQQCQAGQPPTVEPCYLTQRSIPMGILPTWRTSVGNLTLDRGDILLLASDGITEATIKQLKDNKSELPITSPMLNQSGLWQILLQESKPFDLNRLLNRVRQRTNNVQEDDQTLLSLEVL